MLQFECRYFELPATTKSAISICFSPDGQTFASTHGDHTVKIVAFDSGIILQTLEGHPRTPWTVKYNLANPRIVASGCLGYQVRVWDCVQAKCLYITRLNHAIISLAFHPTANVLAIASGSVVHVWDYQHHEAKQVWKSDHTLRCVNFMPTGSTIIIGEANDKEQQRSSAHLTVKLQLWEFDCAEAIEGSLMAITQVRPIRTDAHFDQFGDLVFPRFIAFSATSDLAACPTL
jgi:activator-of-BECN1-regulated-autophagy protein 1